MKFLIDECVGYSTVKWFLNKDYDTIWIAEKFPGYSDTQVLDKALQENRILVTRDKDFGDMIFRHKKNHCGILLLKFEDKLIIDQINSLKKFFSNTEFAEKLKVSFVVLSSGSVRVIEQKYLGKT